MRFTFLGTSSAVPTKLRNVSGLALQFDQRGTWWLFDCGEATQHQVQRAGLSLARLERVFVSHLHGDHCFGLPGLLASRGMQSGETLLTLHGPRGIAAYLRSIKETTYTNFAYPIEVPEIHGEGLVFEDEEYRVRAVPLPHAGLTLSYVVEEKERPGRFRADEAQALGLRPGPLFAQLKRGEKVTLPDGRVIDGATLVDPPRRPRKAVLVFDTIDSAAMLPHAQGADLVIHEATYLERTDAELAKGHRHATARMAGAFAASAGAGQLAMTHFSPRYDAEDGEARIDDLIREAQAHFSGPVYAARDFMEIAVQRSVS